MGAKEARVMIDSTMVKTAPIKTMDIEPVVVDDVATPIEETNDVAFVNEGEVIVDTIGEEMPEYVEGTEMPIIDDMPMPDEGGKGFKIPNGVVYGIVIAICVAGGVFLGIKAGKKSANK